MKESFMQAQTSIIMKNYKKIRWLDKEKNKKDKEE